MTQPHILIVDDDLFVRDVLARYVRQLGYASLEAPNAAEALRILTEGTEVDVILSDIMMPQMSGIEMLKKVHELDPELPVAMITGAATLENSIAALNAGAYAYMLKPVKGAQVEEIINKGLTLREQTRSRKALEGELALGYRALEEQLLQLQDQEHSTGRDDIDPLSELIRGIRHELGNAATAIKLNLSVLEQDRNNPSALREHLHDLETTTDELVTLVTRLKQYPRKHTVSDYLDLREAMTELAMTADEKAHKHHLRLNVELPDGEIYVRGTDVEIIRVCNHILDNAFEATTSAGGKTVEMIVTQEPDTATIIINDEGPGFPLDMVDRLFSPGYTTKITDGTVRGLGLGLFIARATVNLYGGQIWLENRTPKGASVHIRLPLVPLDDAEEATLKAS